MSIPIPTGAQPVIPASEPGRTALQHNVIGLREVLFQSVTAMSPAGALAVSVAIGANYAGGALTLAMVFAFLPCLTVAVAIGQLARHLPSAGGFAVYPAHALHPNIGFLVGWGYAFAAATWGPAIALMIGVQVAGVLTSGAGPAFHLIWIATSLAATLLVMWLGYSGLRMSAIAGTLLGTLEIVILLALSACLIVKAGSANSWRPFGLGLANVKGYEGWAGVIAGVVYTVQAFVGFEAAAPLAEEARSPRSNIGRATLGACISIAVFLVLNVYSATVGFAPRPLQDFAASPEHGSPWYTLARSVWGAGWIIVFLAVMNSNIAGQNAFSTAATRTWYALGRTRLLPRRLALIHPGRGSPYVAVLAQFGYTIALGALLALIFGPIDAYVILATTCAAVSLVVYIAVNLSCTLYYARFRRAEFNWLLHGVIPIAGSLLLIPVVLTALGIGQSVFHFIAPLPYPVSLCGPILGSWFVAGLIYLSYLTLKDPERLRQMRKVFVD
jgi:amino acid transporter